MRAAHLSLAKKIGRSDWPTSWLKFLRRQWKSEKVETTFEETQRNVKE